MALRTPLYPAHIKAHARMVEFAGWDMPVQYAGVIEEHTSVRERAGMFDVSHMGEVTIEGPRALEAAQRLVTNDLSKCKDGQAQYSGLLNEQGGFIDDIIVYRHSAERLFVCVNASGREKDFEWMKAHEPGRDGQPAVRRLGAGGGAGPARCRDRRWALRAQGPRSRILPL